MFKSMTAYGRANLSTSLGRFSVEIQSVNRKHLEINTFLPKELLRFDPDIKKWVSTAVGRGQVNVKVSVAFDREIPLVVAPNLPLARQVKSAWAAIGKDLKLHINENDLLNILMRSEGILRYDEGLQDEEGYRQALKETIQQALLPFNSMKIQEGRALHADIAERFARLDVLIQEIAVKAPGATERYRQKLMERLNEVLGASIENEERLLREVCVYAERIDITEELTRFRSHLKQAEKMMQQEAGVEQGVGKTLEFVVQELNREINTIGSKSSDIDIAKWVIEIKSELERIREQIQNIE